MLIDRLIDPKILDEIGQWLIDIRLELGYTQGQFDKMFDLAPKTVQRYESVQYRQCTLRRLKYFYTIAYKELKKNLPGVDNTTKA